VITATPAQLGKSVPRLGVERGRAGAAEEMCVGIGFLFEHDA
jgi:hypothetical protein